MRDAAGFLGRLFGLAAFLAASLPASAWMACDGRLVDDARVLNAPLCLPSAPQRIVALDPTYSLGMALELDLPVAGAPLTGMQDARLQKMAEEKGITDIGRANEPSVEQIVALQPDLILGDAAMHGQVYDLASRIAPTLLIDAQNWKDYFGAIAAATGRAGKADAAFVAYEARAADIRRRMPDVTLSVIRVTPHGLQVYLDGPAAYAPFAVLKDAGVKRTDYETTVGNDFMKRPDWESVAELDGDLLLYIVGSSYDVDKGSALEAETLANPLWQMLPAVKAGRAHRVDVLDWMSFSGLASANRILDDVERYLLAPP
jgi:iron complex transport system substrate-binding protein